MSDTQTDRNELDYSESSGPNDEGKRLYDDTAPTEHDGRGSGATGFDPREAPSEMVIRDGQMRQKWSWFNQLNTAIWDNETTEREVDIERDVTVVCEYLNDCGAEESLGVTVDPEDVVALLSRAHEDRERGLQFGQNAPLEATILAAVSLIANRNNWRVRQEPTTDDGTPVFLELCESFTPEKNDIHSKEIRRLRKHLHEYI